MLAAIQEAAGSMHLEIEADTPLMEARSADFMSYSPNSLKGVIQGIIKGITLGVIMGDARSLDYDSKYAPFPQVQLPSDKDRGRH